MGPVRSGQVRSGPVRFAVHGPRTGHGRAFTGPDLVFRMRLQVSTRPGREALAEVGARGRKARHS